MKTVIRKTILFLLLFSLVFSTNLVFAEEETDITKEYEFTTDDKDNLTYDVPEKITEGDTEYVLKTVTYGIVEEDEPYTVEREVNLNNLEDFKEEIKEQVDGKEIVLKAEEPKWEKKELPREKVVKETERAYVSGSDIPTELLIDGDRYIESRREYEDYFENFTTPAFFAASDKDSKIYSFNEKLVEINGDEPHWEGWVNDVLDYLKISSDDYIIDSMVWNGEFKEAEDETFTREAKVSGKYRVSNVYVTYTYDSERELKAEDITYLYTAKVTYKEDREPSYKAVARATYSPVEKEVEPEQEVVPEEKGLSLAQKIGIGAGVGVLAAAGAGAFFFLGKKRKEDKE